jgi:mannosyltransferase
VRSRQLGSVVALAVLLTLGSALRLFELDRESLWTDEGATMYFAQSLSAAFQDANPPLYYLLMHFWIAAFGTSEIALRLPSAIFGVATVWLALRLADDLLGRRAAVYAAGLLALSTLQIYYSQEARAYSLFAFLGVASMFWLSRLVRRPGARTIAAYSLSSILMLYTHPYAVLLVASQWVFVALAAAFRALGGRALGAWLVSQAVVVLAIAPWAATLILRGRLAPGYPLPPVSPGMLKETLLEYANDSRPLGYLFVALVTTALLYDVSRRRRLSTAGLSLVWVQVLLLTWSLGTIVFAAVASMAGPSIYYPRYTIAASVGVYLLIGYAVQAIRPRWASYATAVVVGGLMLVGLPSYYSQAQKEQWREAAAIVDAAAEPGALVVFDGLPSSVVFDRYSRRTDLDKEALPSDTGARSAIQKWTASRPQFWLLHLHSAGPLGARLALSDGFEVARSWPLVGLDLDVVQRVP